MLWWRVLQFSQLKDEIGRSFHSTSTEGLLSKIRNQLRYYLTSAEQTFQRLLLILCLNFELLLQHRKRLLTNGRFFGKCYPQSAQYTNLKLGVLTVHSPKQPYSICRLPYNKTIFVVYFLCIYRYKRDKRPLARADDRFLDFLEAAPLFLPAHYHGNSLGSNNKSKRFLPFQLRYS